MFGAAGKPASWPLGINPAVLLLAVFLIGYPLFASDFFTFQIGAYSLILGTIALSLTMLAAMAGWSASPR